MIVTDKERKASKGQKSINVEICWLESQSGSKGPLLTGDYNWHYLIAAPRVLHRERQLWGTRAKCSWFGNGSFLFLHLSYLMISIQPYRHHRVIGDGWLGAASGRADYVRAWCNSTDKRIKSPNSLVESILKNRRWQPLRQKLHTWLNELTITIDRSRMVSSQQWMTGIHNLVVNTI